MFLIDSEIVCISTEGALVYENLSESDIKFPFINYFEKIK